MTENHNTVDALLQQVQELKRENAELKSKYTEEIASLMDRETSLRRSEEKHRLLVENSHDIIYTLDPEGRFLFVSPAWNKMLGHDVSQIIGERFSSFIHPEDIIICQEFISAINESKESHDQIEYRIFDKNGEQFWHTSSAVPILNEHGEVVCIEGIATDITIQKISRLALHESEQRFRKLLHSVPMVAIQGYNREGITQYWNEASERFYGYTSEEAIGTSLLDLIIPPPMRTMVMESIKNMMETGIPIPSSELTLMRKDGSTIDVYSSHAYVAIPGCDPEMFCIDIDISERKKAQKLIEENIARLRRAEKASKSGNWELHLESRTMIASEGAERLYGVTGGEFSLEKVQKFPLPEYRAMLDEALKDLIVAGRPYDLEFKIRQADTGEILDIHSVAEYEPKEKILFGVIQDISSRKKTECALKESEEKFKAIANFAASWEAWFSPTGKLLWMNSMSEQLTGFTPEEYYAAEDYLKMVIAPVDKEMVVEKFQLALTGGSGDNLECRALRKDGSEVWVSGSWRPILDTNGNSLGFRTSFQDITKRKAIEAALKESEEKYRTLIQYASDPIFSFNPDGIYRFVNEAFSKVFGKSPEEIIGTSVYSLFSKEEGDRRFNMIQKVCATGLKDEIEVRVPVLNGPEKHFLTLIDPIFDEHGKVLWVSCISKDITDRKRAEEEVRQANKALEKMNTEKDKLFSIIAHDLKSPFHGLIGLTGLMASEKSAFTAAEFSEFSKELHNSVLHSYRLIENLLEWAQLQKNAAAFSPKEIKLFDAFSTGIESVRQRAIQKDITILNEIPYQQVVIADEKMLNAILRNLLSNAVKFTSRGGKVIGKVRVDVSGGVELSVMDTGIGISDSVMKRLFKIGENVRTNGTEDEPSTGLGLLLCKEFVEKHGGKIRVESKEGYGSTFFCSFPRTDINGEVPKEC